MGYLRQLGLLALCYSFATSTVMAAQAIPSIDGRITNTIKNNENAQIVSDFVPADIDSNTTSNFYIKKIVVETNIPNNNLNSKQQSILKKYDNKHTSIIELQNAVHELTVLYRSKGYPAATAYLPEQTIKDGIVTINVELGKYGNIILENNSVLKEDTLQKILSKLKKGQVIRTTQLESTLNIINDLGGVRAGGILKAGSNIGESDLVVRVIDGKSLSYSLYSENYGSKSSGRYRYGLNLVFNEMNGHGDRFIVNGSMSNQRQHNYSISYDQLVHANGTRLQWNIGSTDYELGNKYSSMGAVGEATSVGILGVTPLRKTINSQIDVKYGWCYRDLKDEMKIFDYIVKKHSNSFNLGISGVETTPTTKVNYDLNAYHGILVGDKAAISNIPIEISTVGTYSKATFNANILQNLAPRLDMSFNFQSQIAGNNLDGSEQFYLGGPNGVRAYPQGEGSGDEGYQASAELRYYTKLKGLSLSAFFDAGHVKYSNDGIISGGTTLKGWGLGTSWTDENGFWARIDYARRIGLAKDSTEDAKSRNRIWFILGKSF